MEEPFVLLDHARLGQFVFERLTPLGDVGADRSLNVSLYAGAPVARQHEKHIALSDFLPFHNMLFQQNACLERIHLHQARYRDNLTFDSTMLGICYKYKKPINSAATITPLAVIIEKEIERIKVISPREEF